MKNRITIIAASLMCAAVFGEPTITGITAKQRYPWNGKVDVAVSFAGSSNEVASATCTFAATNVATSAALPVDHVTAIDGAKGSGTTWTRRFVWDATADVGTVKIADVALTATAVVAPELGGVQLWENGPYWAECNVGASQPEEYGYYFWWGDTVGYKREGGTWTDDSYYSGVTWVSSTGTRMSSSPFDSSTCPTYNKSNSQLQSAGYIDSTGNLVAAHDAATAHLGAPWRMPTEAEFSALVDNTTTTWTTRNGMYGRLVTGKGAYASRSIFLPAAGYGLGFYLYCPGSNGYYWSSSPNSGSSYDAWSLRFLSSYFDRRNNDRYRGQSVRPVREFAK